MSGSLVTVTKIFLPLFRPSHFRFEFHRTRPAINGNDSLRMKKAWHNYLQILNYVLRPREVTESGSESFDHRNIGSKANRNAVLLLIGHGKRTSLETNLVSENELAVFSKVDNFDSL